MDIVKYYITPGGVASGTYKRRMADQGSCSQMTIACSENATDNNPSLEVRENDQVFKERFACLYNNERLSDIILQVGDERFYAHRFMLVVCSEVFEAMLNEERWRESKLPEVTLTEVDECVPVFSNFLKYLYTGSVSLTTDNALPVLLLADKYNIAALSQMCVEYMLHHVVESPDTNRTLSWYQYAKMTGNSLLVDKCRKFILSNFDIILKTNDWIELTKTEVMEFLSSNDLVVSDEFYLWQKVEKWLSSQSELGELKEVIKEVIPMLRFMMIPPKMLLEVEKSELYTDYKEAFMDKLNAAYRHHSLMFDQLDIKSAEEKFRNYTSDMYGVCFDLMLKNYKGTEKGDSKIVKRMNIPYDFVSAPGAMKDKDKVTFEVVFWPKGPIKTFSWYGSISENATISLRLISRYRHHLNVQITYVVYGIKNGVRYIAFSYTNSHKFNLAASAFIEENLMLLKRLNEENSPYLVEGNLEAKLFIKVMDVVKFD